MLNKEAYQLIQNLGIKSILKRFDRDIAANKDIEKLFSVIVMTHLNPILLFIF